MKARKEICLLPSKVSCKEFSPLYCQLHLDDRYTQIIAFKIFCRKTLRVVHNMVTMLELGNAVEYWNAMRLNHVDECRRLKGDSSC